MCPKCGHVSIEEAMNMKRIDDSKEAPPDTVTFEIGGQDVLVLDEQGMVYNGKRIFDAGEAYMAFIDVMKGMKEHEQVAP